MEQAELLGVLKSTGLRVAYHHYIVDEKNSPPKPPYLVYLFNASDNFSADDKVYSTADGYQVELYTTKKDPSSEKLVENALNAAEIYWDKSETYIESEKLFRVLYEIEI